MKKKLAVFTPLPPAHSGISDYSVELGSELSKYYQLTFVIDNWAPEPTKINYECDVIRLINWSNQNTKDYEILYNMGNNSLHEYIFHEALKRPGYVILHDYSIHHFFLEHAYKYPIMVPFYIREYNNELGIETSINQFSRSILYPSELTKFIVSMNDSLIKAAKGIIVHSKHSYEKIQFKFRNKKLLYFPFPHKSLNKEYFLNSRSKAKKLLGINENTFVISSLGYVTPPKQIEFILNAIEKCQNQISDFKYLIVGEVNKAVPIKKIINKLRLNAIVDIIGYVEFKELHNYIEASDLVINLRYPTAGETSAALYRVMGMGRAAVVFDYDSFSELPDDTLSKIPLDTFNTNYLECEIIRMFSEKKIKESFEKNSKKYIQNYHDLNKNIDKLKIFLK